MNRLRQSALLSIGLGILSVVAIGFCHLALTDIWHGEGDLTMEWRMLQAGFLVILLFHLSALVTLVQTARRFKESAH